MEAGACEVQVLPCPRSPAMNVQTDLFGEREISSERLAEPPAPASASVRTLAMPCGFMNNKNKPCRRLGGRAVILDGSPYVCRGIAMVHCDPDCFRTDSIPVTSYSDDDIEWDRP
ncbi:hypothetical protein S2M10_24590 [Sphingomonas sp. S2M10]|jgi:hypothetical protein|nr:hypothetical protein [Sphingomonas sp. S2M10]